MRHTMLSLVPLLLVAACADAAAPNSTDSPAAAAPINVASANANGAQVLTQHQLIEETYELALPKVVQCVGEPIMVTGRTLMVLQEVVIPGDRFHGTFHMTEQGSSGVGVVTGLQYQFVQTQNEGVRIEGGLPYTGTAIFDRRVISQGDTPNFYLHNVYHFTINANGDLVVERNEVSRVCR
jgi:hypothetical protein